MILATQPKKGRVEWPTRGDLAGNMAVAYNLQTGAGFADQTRTCTSQPLRLSAWARPSRAGAVYSLGKPYPIPASAALMADRSTGASTRGVPACASRRSVCELSRVRIRGKHTRASTLFPGVHTQPSPRASRGRAPRMRRPSARSAWPSIQRLGHFASVLLLICSWQS